jgi:hypothetical protein
MKERRNPPSKTLIESKIKATAKPRVSLMSMVKADKASGKIVVAPSFTLGPTAILVPQGYATNSSTRVLATDGLATCVGVALINANGACLSHIDSDGEAIAGQIAGLLLQLMSGPPTQIHISSGSALTTNWQQTATTRTYTALIAVLNQVAPTRHESSELIVDPTTRTVYTKFTQAPTVVTFAPGVYYWNVQKHPFRPEYRSDPFA